MGRYNMRVDYAPSPWEKVAPAIGTAIGQYQQEQDANRTEQNQISAQGGVPVGPAPQSNLDRVRGFIRKRVLGQTDPGAPPAPTPTQPGVVAQLPAVAGYTQPGGASRLGGALPGTAGGPPADGGSPMPYTPRSIGDQLGAAAGAQGTGWDEKIPAAGDMPVVRSGPGNQPRAPMANIAPPSGSIGDALKPYTYTARGGQQYQIDPNRQANAARATKRGELQDEIDIKGGERDKDQKAQIDALVEAGMSPAVARAKVLNNVVKYDETYGQQHPGVMTSKDRMAIQDRIDARQRRGGDMATQLELLRQKGRTNTAEFQQLSIQLRQQQQDDANDRALLSADEAAASRAEGNVTKLQTNPIVSNTPEGQKQITAAETAAEAARTRAAASRDRVAGKNTRPPAGTKKPVAERDAELKAQGMKAADRRAKLKAEGYNVQ